MKKYMDPEMEIVEIDEKDIIFASGETTPSGDEPESSCAPDISLCNPDISLCNPDESLCTPDDDGMCPPVCSCESFCDHQAE